MSIKDLERAGILLPKTEWGSRDLHTKVARTPLIVIAVLVALSAGLIYAGNGTRLTWIGLGLFLGQLAVFTWLSLRAIR